MQNPTVTQARTFHLGPKAERNSRRFGEDASSVIICNFFESHHL